MKKINLYITEKLKINKDSKLEKRSFPEVDDKVIVLYTDENTRQFLFGKIDKISPKIEPTGGFTVTYMIDGKAKDDFFYFNETLNPHWMGRTGKPGYLCYDYQFVLKELNNAISKQNYEFDDEKIKIDNSKISTKDYFEAVKKIIEKDIE